MNPVLVSLLAQRDDQVSTMDALLNQVDGRDLVDAERSLLDACRQRIEALDAQIEPLQKFEGLRDTHHDTLAQLGAQAAAGGQLMPAQPRRADGGDRTPAYRGVGEYLVDYMRAYGITDRGNVDTAARGRIEQTRVVADQKTSDTPGILPTPIVGGVVSLIDANRPLITSLGGARPMGNIPGATFTRPKVTTHSLVGAQAGEKTQLPSQKMTIAAVSFTKSTYGGTVDISRQDIDWTSPAAWDILVRDLADEYSVQTETAVATAFKAAATGTAVVVAANTLAGWTLALYTAAMHSYAAGFRMPDRVWCSLDVWAALGSLVDVARVVLPADAAVGGDASDSMDAGGSSLANFRGDILGLPRIVCPTFAAGTCIVGPSSLYEVYEDTIGLLSVIEPSILGVQVAYGGYLAQGSLGGAALVPLTAPAGMPTMMSTNGDGDGDGDTPANGGSGKAAGK